MEKGLEQIVQEHAAPRGGGGSVQRERVTVSSPRGLFIPAREEVRGFESRFDRNCFSIFLIGILVYY